VTTIAKLLPDAARDELRALIPYVIAEPGAVRVAVRLDDNRLVTLAYARDVYEAHRTIYAVIMLLAYLTGDEDALSSPAYP